MRQVKAKIISNKRVAQDRLRMRLEAPSISRIARPGQFVMVKCSSSPEPFLRRPFSFHRIERRSFELLYQVIGRGTKALSERMTGERLDIIGPLGNGFEEGWGASEAILIAGGIGVAPLLALAKDFNAQDIALIIFLGAKTKSHILCLEAFKRLGARIEIATEDGSRGYKGFATDLLSRHCEGAKRPKQSLRLLRRAYGAPRNDVRTAIYACGPREMLKAVAQIAKRSGVSCQVSFEERMACGTGVCLGCAVKTVTGFKMACKDGPVFNAGSIIW